MVHKRLSTFTLVVLIVLLIQWSEFLPSRAADEEVRLQQLAMAAAKFNMEYLRWPERLSDLTIYLPEAVTRPDGWGNPYQWHADCLAVSSPGNPAESTSELVLYADMMMTQKSGTLICSERLLFELETQLLKFFETNGTWPVTLDDMVDTAGRIKAHGIPAAAVSWQPGRLECRVDGDLLQWQLDTANVEFQIRSARRRGALLARRISKEFSRRDTEDVSLSAMATDDGPTAADLYLDPWRKSWQFQLNPSRLISSGPDLTQGTMDDVVLGVPRWSPDGYKQDTLRRLAAAAVSLLEFRMRRGHAPSGGSDWFGFQQVHGVTPRSDALNNPLTWDPEMTRVGSWGWDGLPDSGDEITVTFADVTAEDKLRLTRSLLEELAAAAARIEAGTEDTVEGWLPFVTGEFPDAWRMTDGWGNQLAVDFPQRIIISLGPDGVRNSEDGTVGDDVIVSWTPQTKKLTREPEKKTKKQVAEEKKSAKKKSDKKNKDKKKRR